MTETSTHCWSRLAERFRACFGGGNALRFIRAPGRVNLIGEHIDYAGLPVMPMTIDREIRLAFSPRRDRTVRLRSCDDRFAPATFESARSISPSPQGAWDNYARAAWQTVNQNLGKICPGADILVEGDIPPGAGLSSSSALVVACALAVLAGAGEQVDPAQLAAWLAEGEQYVGTRGGGMDQTVILCGRRGYACRIDFIPRRIEHVPLPDSHAFILCDSGRRAEKSGAMRARYNMQPHLCRLLTALMARRISMEFGEPVPLRWLGDLWLGPACLTTREFLALADRALPDGPAGPREVALRLGCSVEEVREQWFSVLPDPDDLLDLRARAQYTADEYRRVELARDALYDGDMETLGALMLASHEGCRDLLGVSCPALDETVEAALYAGAVGARLTGAGFGGFVIALVENRRAPALLDAMNARFSRLFPDLPGPGAFPACSADPAGPSGY
ncbi:MAG TPA: galactokinase family protein [Candidatus Hydrogenedentes bacterium]|nr:galactokinase family protein [Candidatus Hydrogenedentota bacterium]